MILFDRSSSMNGMLDGVPKIEMGRKLFRQLALENATNEHVAVRFFAGGVSETDAENCKTSKLVLPFGARKGTRFESLYQDLTAKGKKTPLTHALELAKADLVGWSGARRIILISDGMDTCGSDPLPLSDDLANSGIELDIIGLGEPAELWQLAEMGLSTGAEFQLAGSYGDFAGALGNMLPGLPPLPSAMLAGGATRGGAPAGASGSPVGAGPTGGSGASGAKSAAVAPAGAPSLAPLSPDQPIVVELRLKPEKSEPEPIAVEVILDASGSMAARLEGRSKISLAMAALEKTLGSLDAPNIHLGFRAYGFDASLEKTPEASCPNTELLTRFAPSQAGAVLDAAKALAPYGYTPIADSILAAADDLRPFDKMKRQIVLITDGEETCGGDPIAALRAIAGICVDVNAHIIGFDLDPKARAEMQAIAAAGCGMYLDAPNGPELEKALLKITEVVAEKTRIDWDRYVNPVTDGETLETAQTLTAGAYTFEHHLGKGEKQYFHIPLTEAQRLRLVVTAQGRLVRYDRDGKLVEQPGYDFTSFWADFLRADGSKIKGPQGRITFRSVDPGHQKEIQLLNMDEGGIYFLVHANSMMINKDTRIDLLIDEADDIVAGFDAPDEYDDTAPVISFGQNIVGHIGLQDRTDIYRLTAPSASGDLSLNFNATHPQFKYRIIVKRADTGRAVKRFHGRMSSQSLEFSVADGISDLILEVSSQVPGNRIFSSYTFVVGN